MLIFSKKAFLKSSASSAVRRLLKGHLDELDGVPVFQRQDGFYETDVYIIEGEQYQLYPVLKEWTEETSN